LILSQIKTRSRYKLQRIPLNLNEFEFEPFSLAGWIRLYVERSDKRATIDDAISMANGDVGVGVGGVETMTIDHKDDGPSYHTALLSGQIIILCFAETVNASYFR